MVDFVPRSLARSARSPARHSARLRASRLAAPAGRAPVPRARLWSVGTSRSARVLFDSHPCSIQRRGTRAPLRALAGASHGDLDRHASRRVRASQRVLLSCSAAICAIYLASPWAQRRHGHARSISLATLFRARLRSPPTGISLSQCDVSPRRAAQPHRHPRRRSAYCSSGRRQCPMQCPGGCRASTGGSRDSQRPRCARSDRRRTSQ